MKDVVVSIRGFFKRKTREIRRITKTLKKDYRHYICMSITVFFLVFILLFFRYMSLRIVESIRDVGNSLKYYFSELLELDLQGTVTVNEESLAPFVIPFGFPQTWEEFTVAWSKYWTLWASKENFNAYILFLADVLFYLSKVLCIALPIISAIIAVLAFKKAETNNDYNRDSKPLKAWKRFEKKHYVKCKKWTVEFKAFLSKHSYYVKIWVWMWAFAFNFVSIGIEALAYYLFFVASWAKETIYLQFIKLLKDLSVVLAFIPVVGWVIISCIAIDKIRKKIGYANLNHNENKNRGFVNERPIVYMLCGTMGKRKTMTITDMAISQELMFRDKAFEKILECDMKFPTFPWINLEKRIRRSMERHNTYNLATCRRFVKNMHKKFLKNPCRQNIFTYDYQRYGMTYDDGLQVVELWDILETYVQLYFLYVIQSSLLISNYSIRVDAVLEDLGNFPLWNAELFKTDARMQEAYSRHAKILDFDLLRLGKKMLAEHKNCFEFGVIVITEIGKERQNNLELQQTKKTDENANQKNDLFNAWLKMVRHSATIDNFPFVRVIVDEQRPESWGADARDLCEIVYIDEVSDMKLAMPLFSLEDLIIEGLIKRFQRSYYQYRFERGDNTLRMYIYHALISKLYSYRLRIYNTFGRVNLHLNVEKGTMDGTLKTGKYYLQYKKILSKRYSTDCFSSVFEERAMRAEQGFEDQKEYKTEKATFAEMQLQNSYFVGDLVKIKDSNAFADYTPKKDDK